MKRHFVAILVMVALAGAAFAQTDPHARRTGPAPEVKGSDNVSPGYTDATGGPDAFGYSFADTAEPNCAFQFVDIAATGALVVSGDDVTATVALSEPFTFYGVAYNALDMVSNGFLSTATDSAGDLSNDCPLPAAPSTGTGGRIYSVHDDLITNTGFAEYFAACPRPNDVNGSAEGCTVFQWDEATHFSDTVPFDFQTILYHTTGEIVMQWDDRNPETGSGSTTGIQDPAAAIGLTYACDTAGSLPANAGVCFFGPGSGPDLSITKTASNAAPGVSEPVTFTIDVTNNGPGDQTGVTVTDIIPAGLTYDSDTCGGMLVGDTWTWDIGSLTETSTVSCDLVAIYDACCVVNNTASVSGDELDDPSNNTSTASLNAASNVIADGSFEAGSPNPSWTEASTNFGTPLCTVGLCGDGGGTAGPNTGDWWSWFGGIAAPEVGSLSQDVVIASGASANLKFSLWNGAASGNGVDNFEVLIDGVQIFEVIEGDPTYAAGYVEVVLDVSAFADDALHTIAFVSTSTGSDVTNFSLDDVSLLSCAGFVDDGDGPPEIPTLGQWGLMSLLLMLAMAGIYMVRRQ